MDLTKMQKLLYIYSTASIYFKNGSVTPEPDQYSNFSL